MTYTQMSREELLAEKAELEAKYDIYKSKGLKLDMSRGKPGAEQLDISRPMLDVLTSESDLTTDEGVDCRNYGVLDGIPAVKKMFADILEVDPSEVFVGGNSSLNLMFDVISCFMTKGIAGCEPWIKQEGIKFLCPVPGYDRHFGITEYYGIEMINVPMDENGPDMDMVEKLVSEDEKIKGIWCVPKYANPSGITYSDEVVRRFAALKPAAKDFRIMWDNAYVIHDAAPVGDKLLSLMDECKKNGTQDMVMMFTSTSKITFPGAGVSAFACSEANMKVLKARYNFQTIGFDKINQLRHLRYLKDSKGLIEYMQKHRAVIEPKFDVVLNALESSVKATGAATWQKPKGGYFISVDVTEGTAKEVVQLCKEAGVVLTGAGATYPYKKDPKDSNIRIAPTYPSVDELAQAIEIFCVCTKLAAVKKLLG
ncbi:MAG: aminotransferase class I/II-fold pyridoxal phosphate-dependent enzyme [Clostridia bacterium]|nr:aminotransferase class I/II-fold pyridoxal phosphate-dependent enzyme [Clostridia bacterium]